ncbi:MAG: radical SAM protein, partial [Candidatus Aenigmatarchaeota archaeon]
GMTGGEPLMKIDRVTGYIRLLKKAFGKRFHIHLYTNGTLATDENLKKLHDAGLDELRIHMNKEAVKKALKFPNWSVGMEVPCLPGRENELFELVDYLESAGAQFLNLNELEFSDRNVEPMEGLGFALRSDSLTAVDGSRETADAVLEYARGKKLSVHFCTARLKLDCQLRNRLINRANSVRKPFEKVTANGFLRKGVVEAGDLEKAVDELKGLNVPAGMIFVNAKARRIEISEEAARAVAGKTKLKVAVIDEYPSAEPWDWEKTPLN